MSCGLITSVANALQTPTATSGFAPIRPSQVVVGTDAFGADEPLSNVTPHCSVA